MKTEIVLWIEIRLIKENEHMPEGKFSFWPLIQILVNTESQSE